MKICIPTYYFWELAAIKYIYSFSKYLQEINLLSNESVQDSNKW
jgi:hypothetical protein